MFVGCVERRRFEDVFDDDDAAAPSGFFDVAQGTLADAAAWRDTLVVSDLTVPRKEDNFERTLADVVDEQLPLEEVRCLIR